MVTEGRDGVVRTSFFFFFSEVTRAREKSQLFYAGCVHFTVD